MLYICLNTYRKFFYIICISELYDVRYVLIISDYKVNRVEFIFLGILKFYIRIVIIYLFCIVFEY